MSMSQQMWLREKERKKRERMRRAKRRRNCALFVIFSAIAAVIVIVGISGKSDDDNVTQPENTATIEPASGTTVTADNQYTTKRTVDDIRSVFFSDCAFAGNSLADTIAMYGILKETDFYAGVNINLENVYNTTTSGSTTSVADQFKSKKFKKIFLCFGENELGWEDSGEFKSLYKEFLDFIKECQPNASVYLVAIPPVTDIVSSENDDGITMSNIKEYNKRIKSLAIDNDVYYVDTVAALSNEEGYLPDGVSYDGINLNKAAVIDLLYYTQKKAYIPNSADMIDEETDDEETATEKPEKKEATPTPAPTVNVLKDSHS